MQRDNPSFSPRVVLFITALGSFLSPFDTGMVSVAVPQIALGLGVDASLATWVSIVYMLATTALMVTFGRLSDFKGRKKFYSLGLAISTVAASLSGFSPNIFVLIGLRVLHGTGVAFVAANSWALLTEAFPGKVRGRVLGINYMSSAIGLSIGPVLGGLTVASLGWRAIFWLMVPLYLSVAGLSWWKLPVTAPQKKALGSFDFLGATCLGVGLTLVVLAISFGRTWGWTSIYIIGLFSSGAAVLALFGWVESRWAANPILHLSLFQKNRQFTVANSVLVCNYISAHQSITLAIAFYVQWVMGLSAVVAGVVLLAKFFTMAVLSPLVGWLSDRFSPRLWCTLGLGLIVTSLILLWQLQPGASATELFLRLSVLGVGIGFFSTPNTSIIMGSVGKDKLGLASGTLNTVRNLGQVIGMSIIAGILGGGAADAAGFQQRASHAFLILAGIAFLGMIIILFQRKSESAETA